MSIVILHNPRCSKSRQTLQLLENQGIAPTVREYLKEPLSLVELQELFDKLDVPVSTLVRNKEPEYKEAGLNPGETDEQKILQAISTYPKLMERPIVINADKAKIGRPPEQVLEII